MSSSRTLAPYVCVAPAALIYLPLILVPLAYSIGLSFCRWDGLAASWVWVGLGNYAEMCGDAVFRRALAHNLVLIAASLCVQLPLALLLAVLVAGAGRWVRVVRTGLLVPYILPTVIIALVWKLIVIHWHPLLLGSPRWSLPTAIFVVSWRFVGFHMILYLAGMAAIDPQLYEAARLDGAGVWAQFRCITLPLLRPVLGVSATLAVVGSMKYFDIIYVLTRGGPAHSSELLATYMYKQAFDARRFGYGSALAVCLVLLAAGALGIVAAIRRSGDRGRAR